MVWRLERDLPELLAFLRFPHRLWKKLRTTNAIERQFGEAPDATHGLFRQCGQRGSHHFCDLQPLQPRV